jgi:anti-sigma factor RsiW
MTSNERTDLHLAIGAHALHALPAEEARAFEAHLPDCPTCAEELSGLRATAAVLGSAQARRPPAELRDRVLAAASDIRQDPPQLPSAATGDRAGRHGRRSRRPLGLLAAAAAVLVIGGGITWSVLAGRQESPSVAMQQCVLDDRSAATMAPMVGDGGSLIRSDSCEAVLVQVPAMPSPPSGMAYQLWMMKGTEPVPMGMVAGRQATMVPMAMRAGDSAVVLTIEPAAGSARPSSAPVWAAPLH